VLGEGKLDIKKIFKLVKDFSGPISVEIEFDEKGRSLKETSAAVKKSYEFLKNLITTGSNGFTIQRKN